MTPKSGRTHPRITVKRHRTWLCDLTCPDKCASNLLTEWAVEIPGYHVGRGDYRPPLRISFTTHADALGWACTITDGVRAVGQTLTLALGGIR